MGLSSSKTTQTNDPAAFAKPYITDSLSGLQGGYNQATANLGQNMPAINSAIQRITNNMAQPQPYYTDARKELDDTINGKYLSPSTNPYLGQIADLTAQRTGAQYNSTFGAAGRSHGGLASLLEGQGVGNAVSSLYGDQYNRERTIQQNAVGMAPGFNQDEYAGISPLLSAVGASASLPMAPAVAYSGAVTGATEPYKTTTQKTDPALAPMLAGLALSGIGAATGIPGLGGLMGGGGAGGLGSGLSMLGGAMGGGAGSMYGLSGLLSGLPAASSYLGMGGR